MEVFMSRFVTLFNSVRRCIRSITARNLHFDTISNNQKDARQLCVEQSCLVLGVYSEESGVIFNLTDTAKKFDSLIGNKINTILVRAPPVPKLGEGRMLYDLHNSFPAIALVGMGSECLGYNELEHIDERKEAIRLASGLGVRMLDSVNVSKLFVESFSHAESSAEGASLASWLYQDLKYLSKRKYIKKLELFDSCDFTAWKIGLHKAAAQNLTRLLSETPANSLTPSIFAQTAIEMLSKHNINVNVKLQNWAKLRNLHGFLAVGKGSCEPPVLLELLYEGCDPDVNPILLIGKGVTFDSGGLCLKKCKNMKHSRGAMSGAASVIATIRAIAALRLPINVVGLLPLCVNTPGATAFKPGDIIRTYNGKTILVENTDCEALVMYADVLSYSKNYCPKFILDIGNITPDLVGGMGNSACGVWSNNDSLFETYRMASIHTGERIWRFPLWDYYLQYIKKEKVADYTNKTPAFIGGGACKSAAFLNKFVPAGTDWIHVDTYNTSYTDGNDYTYLREGMTGRSTRCLIEFLAQISCR